LEENEFQSARSRFCVLEHSQRLSGVEGKRSFRPFAAGSKAYAQHGIPFFRVRFESLRKCLPDQFESLRLLTSGKLGKDFEFVYAIPERKDHRLDWRVRAIVGVNIAPRFKIVSSPHVPAAKLRGFILEQPEMHGLRNFLDQAGKIQISGALYAGLPPRIKSVFTAPVLIAAAKSLIAELSIRLHSDML
jgi:hypothetical protein